MSLEGRGLSAVLAGRRLWSQASLALRPGELCFLLGLNGAGKTTLLKVLAGLLPPQEGTVLLDGKDLSGFTSRQRAREVSYLSQLPPRWEMTVEEYALLGAAPYLRWGQVPGRAFQQRAREVLRMLDLEEVARRPIDRLSGGERQRAALAQCLVTDGTYLLLDEPTASLDVRRQHEFLQLLAALVKKGKKGALVSVHDPNLALGYGGRVGVLSGERLLLLERRPGWERELEGLLRPDYGSALCWSEQGYFYWKTEGRE